MKKQLLFPLLFIFGLLCFGMTSCDDDDDPETLVGVWQLALPADYDLIWYCQYDLQPDGTFFVKDWMSDEYEPLNYDAYGRWIISGYTITFYFANGDAETYDFTFEGDRLIIYDYDEPGPNVFIRIY